MVVPLFKTQRGTVTCIQQNFAHVPSIDYFVRLAPYNGQRRQLRAQALYGASSTLDRGPARPRLAGAWFHRPTASMAPAQRGGCGSAFCSANGKPSSKRPSAMSKLSKSQAFART